jgi:hypothetical protein
MYLQGGVFDQAARAARQREIAELNQAKFFEKHAF